MRTILVMLALGAVSLLPAQEKKVEVREFDVRVEAPQMGVAGATAVFVRGGGPMPMIERFPGNALKGAPYSAETVTESVQTLADGNRIVNKQSSKLWRDNEGRTRLESNLAPMGLWVPENQGGSIIVIDDPVSGEHYTLNSGDKTAFKAMVHRTVTKMDGAPGSQQVTVHSSDGKGVMIERHMSAEQGPAVIHAQGSGYVQAAGGEQAHGVAQMLMSAREGGPSESLGKQVIEGVQCEGTRMTFTIPAGQMGNEREMKIVTERWVSPELGIDVLRKHSDPRAGETTYRVVSLIRGEQPKSLFEVPADYKLEQAGAPMMIRESQAKQLK